MILADRGLDRDFLDVSHKTQQLKEKLVNWTSNDTI